MTKSSETSAKSGFDESKPLGFTFTQRLIRNSECHPARISAGNRRWTLAWIAGVSRSCTVNVARIRIAYGLTVIYCGLLPRLEKSGGLGESGCLDVSEPERTSDMATSQHVSLHRLIFSVFARGVISRGVDQL